MNKKKGFGPNAEFMYPLRGGIESLSKGFVNQIKKKNISLNTEVTEVNLRKKTLKLKHSRGDTEKVGFDRLLSTIPLPKLIEVIEDAPKSVKIAASNLEYNTVHTINLGVNRESISEKHWVYFPEKEFIFHRISFPMNFSPNMAPDRTSSITAEIVESGYKRINEDGLIERVVLDLIKAKILTEKDEILTSSKLTLNPAYVIYDLDYKKNVGVLNRFLKKSTIISFGRFGSWKYLNMDHAILEGKEAAQKIINS